MYAEKEVVESADDVEDACLQITLDDAKEISSLISVTSDSNSLFTSSGCVRLTLMRGPLGELMEALDILEKEKEISKETLFEAIENSLLTACRNHFGKADNVHVEIVRIPWT